MKCQNETVTVELKNGMYSVVTPFLPLLVDCCPAGNHIITCRGHQPHIVQASSSLVISYTHEQLLT
jgi:hypothetical protein